MPVAPSIPAARTGVVVDVDAVRRVFDGGVTAVDGVSLRLEPGSFTALLGPSGCGKSTLLRMIAGLDRPTAGEIRHDGTRLERARETAYVFQDAHLLPWRNVMRNVALPLELMGVSRARRFEAAAAAIEAVGLADAATRYPAQLSGGMRMRVSLARALVTRPRLLLLDEPFAALDEITRQSLDDALHTLWRKERMTVVFVTHSAAEAVYLAQRCVVFSTRPAKVVLDMPVDLPESRDRSQRTDPRAAAAMVRVYDALEAR